MSRNDAAIIQAKNVDTKMRAVPLTEGAHLERQTTTNRREHPRKAAKTRGSYLPELKFCAFRSAMLQARIGVKLRRRKK